MKGRLFVIAGLSMALLAIAGCTEAPTDTTTTENTEQTNSTPEDSATNETTQASNATRSGTFVDGEHPTSGTATLVEKDGKRILELDEAFNTSTSGPDLVVVLHRSPDVIGSTTPPAYPINEADYVIIAPLEKYSGAQSYEIPENINLDEFESAAIWCRRFNATFGSARLQ